MSTQLKVTLNERGKNKTNPQFLATGWQNKFVSPAELADWVGKGYAWSGTHFTGGKRSAANARGSNCIVFDFDGELQVDDFWTTKTAQDWCCMTYTSASSTDKVNRFRAVFPLAGAPLATPWEHRVFYQFISLQLAAELNVEFIDQCGQKAERLWYGNDESNIILNADAAVPASVIATVPIPEEPVFSCGTAEGITNLDIERCQWLLRHFITPSDDGEYNTHYLPVLAACAAIGDPMVSAWVDWVSRGHHGDKPENMDARFKWAGLGQRSGPSKLYAMAKAQDPQWSRKLPAALRYGGGSPQCSSANVILCSSMNHVPANIFT